MNKTKIAICMQDLEYQTRFVNCFMNHYSRQYELHVFTNREQLSDATCAPYAVIITGEYNTDEMAEFVKRGEILLCLTEDLEKKSDVPEERVVQTEKYQEVYRIVEVLERLLVDKHMGHEGTCMAVYSLGQEKYQVPFVALMAKILGEQKKVLVIDLQPYSGLGSLEEGMNSMGLEDLLSVVMTGNYSRSRLSECIRHEAEWDYVSAAQNSECLAEGTKEIYHSLMELMIKELGYEAILLNLGVAFSGQMALMEECDGVYLLCETKSSEDWREKAFFQQIVRHNKEELSKKIKKIQIQTTSNHENTWRSVAEKWYWTSLGERLRQELERVTEDGAVM